MVPWTTHDESERKEKIQLKIDISYFQEHKFDTLSTQSRRPYNIRKKGSNIWHHSQATANEHRHHRKCLSAWKLVKTCGFDNTLKCGDCRGLKVKSCVLVDPFACFIVVAQVTHFLGKRIFFSFFFLIFQGTCGIKNEQTPKIDRRSDGLCAMIEESNMARKQKKVVDAFTSTFFNIKRLKDDNSEQQQLGRK